MVKNLPANAGDTGSISELGKSPGEGNGNPLEYSCLGNPMDRGTWQAVVHGLQESDMTYQLNNNECKYVYTIWETEHFNLVFLYTGCLFVLSGTGTWVDLPFYCQGPEPIEPQLFLASEQALWYRKPSFRWNHREAGSGQQVDIGRQWQWASSRVHYTQPLD